MQATPTRFEAVYRRELPFVWAAARRLGVHPAALDDAVQDVFVTAYRRWDDLDYEVSPRAWLYGVTRRIASRYRRTDARTARRKSAVGATSRRKDEPHARLEGEHDVDAVLAALPRERREVFVMSELLDMSGPEIAAELGIPVNTVYSRLRLARKQLARTVSTKGWLREARRSQRPPPGQARRTWALLLPSLGKATSLGTIGIGVGGKIAAAVGLLGALVITSVAIREEPSTPPSATGESRSDATARGSTDRADEPRAAPAAPTEPAVVPSETASPPTTATTLPTSTGRAPARIPSTSPSTTSTTPTTEPSPAAPSLEDEVAVLDRASEALRTGQAARALQWLAEHESRFPRGRLADVRKATRVRALCRLGRDDKAAAEAAALRREHPGSAVARSVSETCDDA